MAFYSWKTNLAAGQLIKTDAFLEITDVKNYIVDNHCPANYTANKSSYNASVNASDYSSNYSNWSDCNSDYGDCGSNRNGFYGSYYQSDAECSSNEGCSQGCVYNCACNLQGQGQCWS
ncbi:MAG: hypothetical protein LBH66_06255 [Oscillospiraceae bacterium]|jgi:hypothetical protein|nr:hypothetical protein [Oscillospiraceae bacterium]